MARSRVKGWSLAALLALSACGGGAPGAGGEFPEMEGPYLGQAPPGTTAVPFAPRALSVSGENHHTLNFSPDGAELYFTSYPARTIQVLRQVSGRWQAPVPTGIPGWEGLLSPDGDRMLFGDGDLWMVDRTSAGWGSPVRLGANIDTSDDEYWASLDREGWIYFSRLTSGRPRILRARLGADGSSTAPEELAPVVNGTGAYHPFIAPDGSYLLFNSATRPDTLGGADLYVSFRQADGSFGAPVHLGPEVNSAAQDLTPVVSPDGLYLFFTRLANDDAGRWTGTPHWVSAAVLRAATLPGARPRATTASGRPIP